MNKQQLADIEYLLAILTSGIYFCTESKDCDDLHKRIGFLTETTRALLDDIDAIRDGKEVDLSKWDEFKDVKKYLEEISVSISLQ